MTTTAFLTFFLTATVFSVTLLFASSNDQKGSWQRQDTIRDIEWSLRSSLDLFHLDCRRFPTTEEGLSALIEKVEDCPNWGPDPYSKWKRTKDGWG
ncbi:MAG: type II secretion system protein GspG, partial [Pseudomonadota bacterium]